MNRNDVYTFLDHIENTMWSIELKRYQIFKRKQISILSQNIKFKNMYAGKTCFILGNGPSLKLEKRLKELKHHTVFTVNQMYRSEIFKIVHPDYHVMMDPLFFCLDENKPSERDTLKRMQAVAECSDIQMIFPIDAYEYVGKYMGERKNIHFIKSRYRLCENYRKGFNMCGFLPGSHNVVQTAIYCAIYMGFKRIVILGCDMTGLLDNYIKRSPEMNQEKFSHVYEYTEEEKQRMREVHQKNDNELMLSGFTAMFHDYKLINKLCYEMGIELLNASQITALDCLKFAYLDNILDLMENET